MDILTVSLMAYSSGLTGLVIGLFLGMRHAERTVGEPLD